MVALFRESNATQVHDRQFVLGKRPSEQLHRRERHSSISGRVGNITQLCQRVSGGLEAEGWEYGHCRGRRCVSPTQYEIWGVACENFLNTIYKSRSAEDSAFSSSIIICRPTVLTILETKRGFETSIFPPWLRR